MPVFDQGYQHWKGQLTGHAWRWWTITRHGVRIGLRSIWVRMLILAAWFPALALAGVLVLWGLFEQKAKFIMPLVQFLNLPEVMRAGPEQFRVAVWTIAFYYFFLIELYFVMLIALIVGPALVSLDLRFNAIPLYFSRPLTRFHYFLGKLGVIGAIVGLVAVAPACIAYVLGVAFSLDLGVIKDTYRILFASLGYGVVVTLSTGLVMLGFSALTRNSRFVMAMWLGLWVLSAISSTTMFSIVQQHYEQERRQHFMAQREAVRRGSVMQEFDKEQPSNWYRMLGFTSNLDTICHELLDTNAAWDRFLAFESRSEPRREFKRILGGATYPWYWSLGVLAGLGLLSVWVLSSRVKSLDRLR
jgi:ABC-2 type transport system permease protein